MSDTFFEQANREGKRVLLYFRADWCSTCKPVEALIEDEIISERGDEFVVTKVDVHQRPDLVERYNILSVPTIILCSPDDQILWRKSGLLRRDEIEDALGPGFT